MRRWLRRAACTIDGPGGPPGPGCRLDAVTSHGQFSVVVLGGDLGGPVIQGLALRHPEWLTRRVVNGGVPRFLAGVPCVVAGSDSGSELMTVVFVDVEASTALLNRVGDRTGTAAVSAQLERVREEVEAYGGNVLKSMGDGFLITFTSPRQAVSFALASQRELAGSTPRLRVGINTGEVMAAESDPLGAAVNAAARIAARAVGGEVLVSDVVRQLVGAVAAVSFVDRGRFRLKGFSERWRLWAAYDSVAQLKKAPTTGRVTELSAVADLVTSTAVGVGRVLLFEGEAGIGKTHLVREATALARQAGIVVVETSADELVRRPGVIPHALLDATRNGLRSRDRLDALLHGTRGSVDGGEDLSFAVVESSVDLVEEMASTTPVLVAAEDLHWADDLSLMVLAALVRRAAVSRFGVIGSMRLSPRHAALDRLVERVRDGIGVHVRLGPLAEVDVVEMANAITGSVSGERLRAKLRMTAGNPLFVSELLRSFDDDGLLRVDEGVAEIGADATPTSLHEMLVRRLSWLPSETSEALRMASLLGTTFSLRELAAIEGRGVPDVAARLREAALAGLIVGDADRLAFRHDLVREAVYGHMLVGERRHLHRAAGQALARIGAPTPQVADQFARGAEVGDVEAITWLERAARDTISVSPESAVMLLEHAVNLATPGWQRRAALQARMIEPLALCGRHDQALAIAEGILATSPDAEVEYAALCGLRTVHSTLGHTTAEIAALHRAAAASGAPVDEARRFRCIAAQLSTFTGAMTIEEARRVADETLAQARADQDATTQAVAHQMLGMIAGIAGYGVESRDHLAAACALSAAEPVPHAIYPVPDSLHALSLLELDALDDAGAAADQAREQAERLGASSRLPLAYLTAGAARYYAGNWDEAVAQLEAGRAVIEETGLLSLVLYYEAALARIAIHRGDLDDAQKHLTVGVQHFTDGRLLLRSRLAIRCPIRVPLCDRRRRRRPRHRGSGVDPDGAHPLHLRSSRPWRASRPPRHRGRSGRARRQRHPRA